MATAKGVRANPGLPVFVSHSSRDAALAEELINLLRTALGLVASEIRCSSVDGYRLPIGVNTEGTLREEVNAATVMIGLITPSSLSSPYVVFELGARWGCGLFLAPLLAGVKPSDLSQPLSLLNALSAANEAQLHQLMGDVAKQLGRKIESPASYVKHIERVKQFAQQVTGFGGQPLVAKAAQVLQVAFAVDGEPPSQKVRVNANQKISVTRVEYMLSSDASVFGDDVLYAGETFELPINYQGVMKIWNTYRPEVNYDYSDLSGPAKLALTVSAGEVEQEVIMSIQMKSIMKSNAMYVKISGSKRASVTAR